MTRILISLQHKRQTDTETDLLCLKSAINHLYFYLKKLNIRHLPEQITNSSPGLLRKSHPVESDNHSSSQANVVLQGHFGS